SAASCSPSCGREEPMSRIGKMPVAIPKGVTVEIKDRTVRVKGPRGELHRTLPAGIEVAVADEKINVTRPNDEPRSKALHGLTRALVANMVEGVEKGFRKTLDIQGVGYKAEPKPYGVNLVVGYSHPVEFRAPEGVKITVENNTVVKIEGADKEKVGQVAAEIRLVRPPEPYKGKGIRYQGEQVRRKAGKTGAK
ncbi:MAG TPA: 50S ribosomal protein L6, partial [Gemmatimonadales bacterium]|nr:50S ribosomal protein L6 [Gemmatimonadales bacterium]